MPIDPSKILLDQHASLLSRARQILDDLSSNEYQVQRAIALTALATELRLSHPDAFITPKSQYEKAIPL